MRIYKQFIEEKDGIPHEHGNSRSGELSGVLSDFLMNGSNDDNDQ